MSFLMSPMEILHLRRRAGLAKDAGLSTLPPRARPRRPFARQSPKNPYGFSMSQQVGIEKLSIDTIRCLSMDAVQAANSGHPGTPMALAPVTYQLWQHRLRFDP